MKLILQFKIGPNRTRSRSKSFRNCKSAKIKLGRDKAIRKYKPNPNEIPSRHISLKDSKAILIKPDRDTTQPRIEVRFKQKLVEIKLS